MVRWDSLTGSLLLMLHGKSFFSYFSCRFFALLATLDVTYYLQKIENVYQHHDISCLVAIF